MKLLWLLPKRVAIAIKEYELKRIHIKLEYHMDMVYSLYREEGKIVETIEEIQKK